MGVGGAAIRMDHWRALLHGLLVKANDREAAIIWQKVLIAGVGARYAVSGSQRNSKAVGHKVRHAESALHNGGR